MGSVGSGVAGEQEFAMKSVGTRTTLPRGPPLSRRSCSTERLLGPSSSSEGCGNGGSADRGPIITTHQERASTGTGGHEGRAAGGVTLDVCGNVVGHEKRDGAGAVKGRDSGRRESRTPPKILGVTGKAEQNSSGLVRPSAFKPVVPKSFHSMQNLVAQSGGGGRSDAPQSLCEPDSPDRDPDGGGTEAQGSMSDSGKNSLTSLPTYTGPSISYGPPAALGPLSASTSHINRLDATVPVLDKPEKPSYPNGMSVSDSSQSSSGKSCLSYQRLCHVGGAAQQPSPSTDDIIQDLEDRLWEKEQEVLHMRRSLDQSEAAIAQVFEEKQRVWEREMEELRQNYAARLQQVTRRAQRTQQALHTHVARLQQDKCRLQEEIGALLSLRDELERKCLDYRKEQADLLPRLEESKWELCQKAGEVSLLKQQLRDSQGEVTQRAGEMLTLRSQLKDLSAQMKDKQDSVTELKDSYSDKSRELERCEGELKRTLSEVSALRDKLLVFEAEVLGLKRALGDHSISLTSARSLETFLSLQSDEAKAQRQEAGELRRQLERLQGELHLERQHRERQSLTFAQERHTWRDEKERVLKYQAQLQLSYVETLQRNQALEERAGQVGIKVAPPSGSPPPSAPPVEAKPSGLHQLAPPWPGPSRLERIESTEI